MLNSKRSLIWALGLMVPAASFATLASADTISDLIGSSIDNFHVVDSSRIYRGARPEDSGIEALALAGIKTIVDLQGGDKILGIPMEAGESDDDIAEEGQIARQNGMNFYSEPMSAINPDADDNEDSITAVLAIVAKPENQPVYFHCRHGSDRTGLIGALIRVLDQGCTPAQAHQEMMDDGHFGGYFWMDNYFQDLVKNDPRTHLDSPAPTCPLNGTI